MTYEDYRRSAIAKGESPMTKEEWELKKEDLLARAAANAEYADAAYVNNNKKGFLGGLLSFTGKLIVGMAKQIEKTLK